MNIALLLEMAAQGMGERTAIRWQDRCLTYDQLLGAAQRAASWLNEQPVDNVVYLGPNHPAFPISLYASALSGRPFAPLNYRLQDAPLRRILERTAPAVAIVEDSHVARVEDVDGVNVVSVSAFETAIATKIPVDHIPENDSAVAVLIFTSGTTGEPKAAILRHRNLTSYVIASVAFMGAGDKEASLIAMPPYHIAGVAAVLSGTYAGRTQVQLSQFDPQDWLDLARQYQITHAVLVPTMLGRILDTLDDQGEVLPDLKSLSCGGGRMPRSVIERALEQMPHVDFVNAYGLTETSSTIAVLGPEDHREAFASTDSSVRRRLDSVGQPMPSIEIEIRDGTGQPVATGQSGEVFVRGDQVAGEYVGQAPLEEDGWFPTKDRGWLDGDGYLYIEGRLDDVIVRGGENIAPGEVEDTLVAHPEVADAGVFGVPDEEWGEAIVAVIVPHGTPTQTSLREWVRQHLRSTKVPQVIVARDALPYNDTGKLLRRTLKAEFLKADQPAPVDTTG